MLVTLFSIEVKQMIWQRRAQACAIISRVEQLQFQSSMILKMMNDLPEVADGITLIDIDGMAGSL